LSDTLREREHGLGHKNPGKRTHGSVKVAILVEKGNDDRIYFDVIDSDAIKTDFLQLDNQSKL
jgi:hypothetical protein